jgi:hypothetical protein
MEYFSHGIKEELSTTLPKIYCGKDLWLTTSTKALNSVQEG